MAEVKMEKFTLEHMIKLEQSITDLIHEGQQLLLAIRRCSDQAVVMLMAMRKAAESSPGESLTSPENPSKPG